jgi:hypothetical protein
MFRSKNWLLPIIVLAQITPVQGDHVDMTPLSTTLAALMHDYIGKVPGAAALLLLAQDGSVSLDDPARRWLPELPSVADAIHLRHILSHTRSTSVPMATA